MLDFGSAMCVGTRADDNDGISYRERGNFRKVGATISALSTQRLCVKDER